MTSSDLLNLVVRMSLLLLIGFLVARILAWKSATIAHRVLVVTLMCSLCLPLLAAIMPVWKWNQPAWMSGLVESRNVASPSQAEHAWRHSAEAPVRETNIGHAAPSQVVANPSKGDGHTPIDMNTPIESRNMGMIADSQSAFSTRDASTADRDSSVARIPVEVSPREVAPAQWNWFQAIVFTWSAMVCLLLSRLFYCLTSLLCHTRRCESPSVEIANLVESAASRFGLRRPVHVLLSTNDSMPMACWLRRWLIILPSNFLEWSKPLQEATLVHELGHIARRDAWSDILVQIAFCLLWPNPLSWMTVRDVRRLRERACDEWALQRSEIDVKTYAQCLLDVVQRCQRPQLRFASTMAGRKDLESRLRWLMSTSRPRTARPATTATIVLAITALSLAVATAQPTRSEPAQSASAGVEPQTTANFQAAAAPTSDQPRAELNEVIVSKDPSPAEPAISVAGVVTDVDGNPLSNMQVVLRAKVPGTHQYAFGIRHQRDVLARTTTNADGRFAFTGIGVPPRLVAVLDNLRAGKAGAELLVWGDGKAINWQPVNSFQNEDKAIQLTAEADVSGTVVDAKGNPVENALLKFSGCTSSTTAGDTFLDEPGDLRLFSSEIQLSTTVTQGRFRLRNMPRDYRVFVECTSEQGLREFALVDTGSGEIDSAKTRNGSNQEFKVHRSPVELIAQQRAWVRIQVVDHNGNPVSGGGIEAVDSQRHYGGNAPVDANGNAILVVNGPGLHDISYAQDPLTPAVGLVQSVDIQSGETPVVTMRLEQTRTLTGRVIDGETGVPLVGAYVTGSSPNPADSPKPHSTFSLAVTGADGIFRMPVVNGKCVLALRHDIDGYYANSPVGRPTGSPTSQISVTVSENNIPDDVVLKVGRGMVITGTVTDGDGRPLANAQVLAVNDKSPYRNASTLTDNDGKYRFQGFSPYAEVHVSTFASTGAASADIVASPDHPFAETLNKTVDLKLSAGSTVTGRVIRGGQPVVGVRVRLNASPPIPPGQDWIRHRLRSETTTDESGTYKLSGLRKNEPYNVEIAADGKWEVTDWHYQSPYSQTNRAEDGTVIELPDAVMLSFGQTLSGIVVDPEGNPVSEFTVSARLASGGMLSRPNSRERSEQPPWAKTDANGQFEIVNLPNELIKLMTYRANPAGGRILYASNVSPELNATNIRIVVDPKLGRGVEDLDAK